MPAADVVTETTIVAQWEDAAGLLVLTRGTTYRPLYQLELVSKTRDVRARAAIKEALRLDAHEAPQSELDRRNKATSDAVFAAQKARVVNKAAFRL